MAKAAYNDAGYQADRRRVLAGGARCWQCGAPATEADHIPPISTHVHYPANCQVCHLRPSCFRCARRQGAMLAGRSGRVVVPALSPSPVAAPAFDAAGWDAAHPVWDVDWLDDLRAVPANATWPRLMTPPHPAAVGSYGPELERAAQQRTGLALRWWQRLAAARMLEHDADGQLVWDACDLTVARQVGKSHLLREACLWRIGQAGRFAEPQTVVHTGKDLQICVEIQRPARLWARGDEWADIFKVRESHGQEEIERLADGSRWMVRAKESVYGLSACLAVVDEAWAVPPVGIEESLVPTLVEHASAQLWLISTAHRKATGLMVNRRAAAVADLASTGADLWVEWSAPPGADLDDEAGWRAASPHWSERRRRLIAARLVAARDGDTDDPDEPDPLAAFTAQWLNRWPATPVRAGKGEPLLDAGVWANCVGALDTHAPGGVVALEEWEGKAAAVALAVSDGAGRFEVDGLACDTWTDAVDVAARFAAATEGVRILVGARMKTEGNHLPAGFPNRHLARLAGGTETGRGLILLRHLTAERRVVHDGTAQLDEQLAAARVYRLASGGLGLVNNRRRNDLLRAALWALDAVQAAPASPAVN